MTRRAQQAPADRWIRSMLFIPATRPEWMLKASRYGSDALIFDLEDSVPAHEKQAARLNVSRVVAALADTPGPAVFVRVNSWESGLLVRDVLAVLAPTVSGVVLPKPDGPDDVAALDRVLSNAEIEQGMPVGVTEILPIVETAAAVDRCEEMFRASRRIMRATGIAGLTPNRSGDLHRALGVASTATGDELLYVATRTVVAARAAGIRHMLGGMTVDIGDIDLLRTSLRRARGLGATASMAIHPSQIEVIHDVFRPEESEVADALAIVTALDAARASGQATAVVGGTMVDEAHGAWARELLARHAGR